MKTYDNINIKAKMQEFNRCIEARIQKIRQQYLEKKDLNILNRIKPLRHCIDSTLNCDYVQGVKVQRYNTLEVY